MNGIIIRQNFSAYPIRFSFIFRVRNVIISGNLSHNLPKMRYFH